MNKGVKISRGKNKNADYLLLVVGADGKNILEIKQDGQILVHGQSVSKEWEPERVTEALRCYLVQQGFLDDKKVGSGYQINQDLCESCGRQSHGELACEDGAQNGAN